MLAYCFLITTYAATEATSTKLARITIVGSRDLECLLESEG